MADAIQFLWWAWKAYRAAQKTGSPELLSALERMLRNFHFILNRMPALDQHLMCVGRKDSAMVGHASDTTSVPSTPDKCPACYSTVPKIRFEIKIHGSVAPEHWMHCFHPWHAVPSEVTPPTTPDARPATGGEK
jgi:hypothetical protein